MGMQVVILSAVYSGLFTIGFIGNMVVIILIIMSPQLRSLTQAIIFNLSLADLVYLLSLPSIISWTLTQDWSGGEIWCKIVFCSESTCKNASMLFIMFLTIDRFLVMCHSPWWKPKRTVKLFATVLVWTWLVVTVLMVPIFMYSRTVNHAINRTMCTVQWPNPSYRTKNLTLTDSSISFNKSYSLYEIELKSSKVTRSSNWNATVFTLLSFTAMYCIPAILIVYCSCGCLRKLYRAGRRAVRMRKESIARSYRKVSKLVLTLAMFYLTCWTPVWAYSVVTVIWTQLNPSILIRQLLSALHILPYLNASFNPFLYAFLSSQFRQEIRNIKNLVLAKSTALAGNNPDAGNMDTMSRRRTFNLTTNNSQQRSPPNPIVLLQAENTVTRTDQAHMQIEHLL